MTLPDKLHPHPHPGICVRCARPTVGAEAGKARPSRPHVMHGGTQAHPAPGGLWLIVLFTTLGPCGTHFFNPPHNLGRRF